MKEVVETNFSIGQVVKHKFLDFRGVIFDVDPEFNNTEEWYQSIPSQIRPSKDQPFYHVFAENDDVYYTIDFDNECLGHAFDGNTNSPLVDHYKPGTPLSGVRSTVETAIKMHEGTSTTLCAVC